MSLSRLITGLVLAAGIMAFVGGIMENVYASTLAPGVTYTTTIQTLMNNTSIQTSTGIVGTVVSLFEFSKAWIGGIWTMMWWDYPFFTGNWLIIKYLFFFPYSIGIISALVVFLRGGGTNA